jgi:uncharacterized protein involved in outer membrane biogenesis
MRIMKKWTIAAACLFLCIIIILSAALWNLGTLIKKAINNYGPGIINAEVHVEGVQTVLLSGEVRLSDFYLGNPAGFKTPHALKAPSVYVDLNEASLIRSTVVIEKIELIGPEINYEKIKGTDNFKQLIKNINGSPGRRGKEDKGVTEHGGKRLIIRDVIFRDAQVNFALSGLIEHRVSARIPNIHLKNIGDEEGGLPPSEAFKILLSALYRDITAPKNIIEDLSRKSGRELNNASDSIRKLFSK